MSQLPGLTVKHLLPGLVLVVAMSLLVVRSFASDEPIESPTTTSDETPPTTSDAPNGDGPAIMVDAPSEVIIVAEDEQLVISGWAADLVGDGTGVETIHVYADGPPGQGGIPLGSATMGVTRADVATATGLPALQNSGFNFNWSPAGLAPGPHTLYFSAYSPASNQLGYSTLGVNVAPGNSNVTNRYLVSPIVAGVPSNPAYANNAQTCSSGYVTASGQCIYSPSSGSCQPGYAYINGACVPSSSSGACPGGFRQNQTQCIPNTTNVSCPSGYVASFGDCVPDNSSSGPSCPLGTIAVSGGCAVSSSNVSCPAGYVFDGVSCVVYNGATSCAPGYALINGVCQPQGTGTPTTAVNMPSAFCQPGYVYTNGACQPSGVGAQGSTTCPTGYQNISGQCVGTATNGQCPTGYQYVNGLCVGTNVSPSPTPSTVGQCPTGYQILSGQCVGTSTNGQCPTGYQYTSGLCFGPSTSPMPSPMPSPIPTLSTVAQCPAGYQNLSGQCVGTSTNGQCPTGYQYTSGLCVGQATSTSTNAVSGGQCPAGSVYQNGACYSTSTQQSCVNGFTPQGVRC